MRYVPREMDTNQMLDGQVSRIREKRSDHNMPIGANTQNQMPHGANQQMPHGANTDDGRCFCFFSRLTDMMSF